MWQALGSVSVSAHAGPHVRDCAPPRSLNSKDNLLSHIKRTEKVDSPKMVLLFVVFH